MKKIHKIISEICLEHCIDYSLLSDDWIIMLEKDSVKRFIIGYKIDINKAAVSNLLDDKYGLYTVLNKNNVPIIDHYIIFKNYDKDKVLEYFNNNNQYLVVKDNSGSCGIGVYKSNDIEEIYHLIDKILSKKYAVCLCPFYNIKTEYRLIILNNKIKLIYGKKKPIIIGDGKLTKRELLNKFNPYHTFNIDDESLDEVLSKNEEFEYNWQFNLSRGAIPFVIDDEKLIKKLKDIAYQALNNLDINFCSIDIIELTNGEFKILECNSGVMLENYINNVKNGYEIAKKIYEEAILEMFK